MWSVTCSGASPSTFAAAARSTVWNCDPTQSCAPPSRNSTVQLSGSMAAWARKGTSYSATSVRALARIASGCSALRATLPAGAGGTAAAAAGACGGCAAAAASARYSRDRSFVASPAWGPRCQVSSSASRPFFAAQKFCPTTATPCASSTTCVTPCTAFTLSAPRCFSRAPKTGGCATTAVCRFGRCTSSPKTALPVTFARESTRRVGLPMSSKRDGSLSATCAGTGRRAAAAASRP